MSDVSSVKRLHKRLQASAQESASLFKQYLETDSASLNSLTTACNVLDRLFIVASMSSVTSHGLLGVLETFDDMPEALIGKMVGDLVRLRARVFAYTDVLQTISERIQCVRDEAIQAVQTATRSVQEAELSFRSVQEPHSMLDLASYCDTWAMCVAYDVVRKLELASRFPSFGDLHKQASTMPRDEATELLRRAQNCAAAWLGYTKGGSTGFASQDGHDAADQPSAYVESLWSEADLALWKLRGSTVEELTTAGGASDTA